MPSRIVAEDRLLPALSPKQAQALLAAHEAGYYAVPRRATTADLGRRLGLSPSTFKEHLQRAEAHAVEALVPLLRQRAASGEPTRAETFAAFSRPLGAWVVLEVCADRIRSLRLAERAPPRAGRRHPHLARILAHLRDGHSLDNLPIELEATGFTAEVLHALRGIPAGTTVTYAELARRLGRPGAARAVGNACAGNPLLLLFPCHRVVPASGGYGNYAGHGGGATKQKLLDWEAKRMGKET